MGVKKFNNIESFNLNNRITDKTLNILYINAQSMKNKLDQLEILLHRIKADVHIMAVAETWVKQEEKKYYNLPGYNAVFSSRQKRGRRGCALRQGRPEVSVNQKCGKGKHVFRLDQDGC